MDSKDVSHRFFVCSLLSCWLYCCGDDDVVTFWLYSYPVETDESHSSAYTSQYVGEFGSIFIIIMTPLLGLMHFNQWIPSRFSRSSGVQLSDRRETDHHHHHVFHNDFMSVIVDINTFVRELFVSDGSKGIQFTWVVSFDSIWNILNHDTPFYGIRKSYDLKSFHPEIDDRWNQMQYINFRKCGKTCLFAVKKLIN